MTRIPPIDSVEHIRQLRGRDTNYAVRRRWPDEAAFLQSFGVERHAETVMPKDLDQVTSSASKDVKITCMGIAPQGLRIDAAADADTVLAGNINLDHLRDGRRRRGDSNRLRRNCHRDQLRGRSASRRTRLVAIALSPTKYLVRIHVVMPSNL